MSRNIRGHEHKPLEDIDNTLTAFDSSAPFVSEGASDLAVSQSQQNRHPGSDVFEESLEALGLPPAASLAELRTAQASRVRPLLMLTFSIRRHLSLDG